jgi:mannose-6-phosphate isomerase
MHRITGRVQHYEWGDREVVPRLLGVEPDSRPWAEWWLGTHPGAPSSLDDGTPLADAVGTLPYLLKVLAAAEPLSLQTHPSDAQAITGFEREHAAGVPIDAPHRLYRDRSAKPELICALTEFDALCGFRPVAESIAQCHAIGADDLARSVRDDGLASTVERLYRRRLALGPIVDACRHDRAGADAGALAAAELVVRLAAQYPDDPSVAVTLLMHRVMLQPGDAIFLGPGNLHAYLRGAGVEIMSASDNVLRGGMTVKHVDVDELLAVLDIAPIDDPRVAPVADEEGIWRYDTPDTPFRLWRWELTDLLVHEATGRELLLCTAGHTDLLTAGQSIALEPGEIVELDGEATVFRVEEVAPPPDVLARFSRR